ncbi:MAG: flagellar export chaperone FliS [Treponema sp.]|mgnify:CR=1 FL=1|nr:flagellar export chaperone FliS [Treponema sp.]
MYNNAYTAYQRTNINTATRGRLIVLLYEGAVKQLSQAVALFEPDGKILAKNIEQFGNCLQKAEAIISELEVSLDMEKGGEIAKNLMALYLYFNEELMQANISKDKGKIESVLKMLKDLTESWRQIASTTANVTPSSNESRLSIQG